jgi:mRNA-degrading endonuclease toxin of MazEF toxin-antitoxin module
MVKHESAVNLDHLQTVEQASLETFLGSLSGQQQARICEALAVALACD